MKGIASTVKLIREIYEDRRLLIDLSTKDVQRRFSGTYFGMVWGILQPLMTIIVYWAVFQFGFRSGDVDGIPFILWFITSIFDFLKKRNGKLGKLVLKLEKKANSKKEQIERLKYLGLVLFVGIPLPGTGAWTGCLIAALLGMDKKKSCLAAIIGVIMAGIIMLIFSYGILGGILG